MMRFLFLSLFTLMSMAGAAQADIIPAQDHERRFMHDCMRPVAIYGFEQTEQQAAYCKCMYQAMSKAGYEEYAAEYIAGIETKLISPTEFATMEKSCPAKFK